MRTLRIFLLLTSLASLVLAEPVTLRVIEENIEVDGKAAPVFGIVQPNGERGIRVAQEDGFHVIVKNELSVPTSVHWHGLVLPNSQDGVPYVTQNPIPPGGQQEYKFPLVQSGTYWMHSHYGLQEQVLASAPLIITGKEEGPTADRDVVVMFSDFSFRKPVEILDSLKGADKATDGMGKMEGKMKMAMAPENKNPAKVQLWHDETEAFAAAVQDRPPVDIDVRYDALLANRRTPDNAEVIKVDAGESILLRLIAGATSTNFFVDTGVLDAELLAVDGQSVEPLNGRFFQLALAQRIDLRVKIPEAGGAFPILALGEGTQLQAGVVLATKGATVPKLSSKADVAAGALDNTQEMRLRATRQLPPAKVTRSLPSPLAGNMLTYQWTINGWQYPNRESLNVREGDRVEMVITNKTMMSHPMHLHGHDFQVTEIDGKPVSGARRDTVLVPPGGTTKIQFDANNPGIWAYHCHIIYHLASGMFTVVKYDDADTAFWQPEKVSSELKEELP